MSFGIFDSHSHYTDSQFDQDRDTLLPQLHQEGVSKIMAIGSTLETSRQSIKLAEKYDFVYATVGIHPNDVQNITPDYLAELKDMASHPKVKAIGEIGLDYFYHTDNKILQQDVFTSQLDLAKQLDLPVVIHNRDANEDTMNILKSANSRGIVHCYSGAVPMAHELIKMGYYLGFTGVLTFKNAKKAVEVVSQIPLEHLLIETDCPYMAPEPNRGKRSHSGMLTSVACKMAEIKGISTSQVIEQTYHNAMAVYNI